MRPYQQLMTDKKHEENKKSKIGQKVAPCSKPTTYQFYLPTSWTQESVSMHKRPTPVRHSPWIKQGRRKRKKRGRERERKERSQEADGKKGSPKKKKLSE